MPAWPRFIRRRRQDEGVLSLYNGPRPEAIRRTAEDSERPDGRDRRWPRTRPRTRAPEGEDGCCSTSTRARGLSRRRASPRSAPRAVADTKKTRQYRSAHGVVANDHDWNGCPSIDGTAWLHGLRSKTAPFSCPARCSTASRSPSEQFDRNLLAFTGTEVAFFESRDRAGAYSNEYSIVEDNELADDHDQQSHHRRRDAAGTTAPDGATSSRARSPPGSTELTRGSTGRIKILSDPF